MKQNSYAEFLLMMRDEGSKYNPPTIQLGVVKSIAPIQIALGELPLFENNLYINKYLLEWDETVIATTGAGSSDSHTHQLTSIHHPCKLAINDSVILYEIEKNKKYILLGVV